MNPATLEYRMVAAAFTKNGIVPHAADLTNAANASTEAPQIPKSLNI
eukprot:CAMPEP_0175037708 /NCGR_PEP_ID=MMETSP0005-20121125/24516_1 /TAXON_ID=420556 /ORGANISM="Ochromonas sp., Strain CCMP1393" /LENGTH=46 /DNA_ID= /DNA_START= /DNA_END= /DNA_ORIENTATION=